MTYPASFVVATCDELLAHINACHAVLADVEWSDDCGNTCAVCFGMRTRGHEPNCALRACLDGKP